MAAASAGGPAFFFKKSNFLVNLSIYGAMNDGRINHESGFREKLQTCVGVIESTTPYRQNRSEQGDAYFISLRMTMIAHPKTRVGQIKKKPIKIFYIGRNESASVLLDHAFSKAIRRSRERPIRSLQYRGR